MLSRTMALAVATLAIGLMGVTSVSATTVVRTDPGNLRAPAGSTITGGGNGDTIVVTTNLGTVRCGAFSHGVLAQSDGNPSVTGTLTSFTASPCTDTIPVISISQCTSFGPFPHITVTATATGGTNTLTDLVGRCSIAGSTSACYITSASATATFSNANSTLNYSNVPVVYGAPAGVTDSLGSGLCGATGTLNADFSDIHTTGGRTLTVTTS